MTDNTLTEIQSQPEVWQQVLELCEKEEHKHIRNWIRSSHSVLTGMGSSYYVCLAVAAGITQLTRRRAIAVSGSEICAFPDAVFSEKEEYALLAVSRNGKSAETVQAARWCNERYSARTLLVTTVPASPLGEISQLGLLLSPAAEKSRYMTRAFTSAVLALLFLVASETGHHDLVREMRQLPKACSRVLESCESIVKLLAEEKSFSDYSGLGQGPFFGLAAEAMLKLKEMVRVPADACPSLEVMHGPNYLLSPRSLVTLLHAPSASQYEVPLLDRLKTTGAYRFVLCDRATPEIRSRAELVFELGSGLSELGHFLLMMPVMQMFAYYRALATGHPIE